MKTVMPLIYEISSPGRKAYSLPALDVPDVPVEQIVPKDAIRATAPELPEVAEVDLVRHFTKLSQLNHGVDIGFYPLGSCTMKYSPKVNEEVAKLPGFALTHPYQPECLSQGSLQLMYEMEKYLSEIAGLKKFSLQPAAGAHGEYTGLLIIKAYQNKMGQRRHKVLVPDSAHGTNPASSVMAGYEIVQVKSDARGGVDLEDLKNLMNDDVACLMLTNPNTLGLFDENIHKIAEIVHAKGGLLYYDGANANAIMGWARPGDAGFDVCHINLHKTFSTPHGGGGPGSGPVGVVEKLVPFLPVPTVEFCSKENEYYLDYDHPDSIGRVKGYYGNFGTVIKGYTYVRALGPDGLKEASEDAVLNANYMMANILDMYDVQYNRICKHEFVAAPFRIMDKTGIKTLDIAKALLDYGVHPPTVYFPMIVHEALMIEPTETESKETLDYYIKALKEIAQMAYDDPEKVHSAPHTTPVGRLDESGAARKPNLRWKKA